MPLSSTAVDKQEKIKLLLRTGSIVERGDRSPSIRSVEMGKRVQRERGGCGIGDRGWGMRLLLVSCAIRKGTGVSAGVLEREVRTSPKTGTDE